MTLKSEIKQVHMFILITNISINNINNQSFREYPEVGPLPEALAALLPTGVDIYHCLLLGRVRVLGPCLFAYEPIGSHT